MNRAEAVDCWLSHLDGAALSPRQQRELVVLMAEDPSLRTTLLEDGAFDGMLRIAAGGEDSGAAFTAGVTKLVKAQDEGDQFRESMRKRLQRPSSRRRVSPGRPSRGLWPIAAILAAACIAVFVATEALPWLTGHASDQATTDLPTLAVLEAGAEARHGGESIAVGSALHGGDRLDSHAGRVVLAWSDGTRADFSPATVASIAISASPSSAGISPGKRLELESGSLTIVAARQDHERPLVISTTHADATIVGTRFVIAATSAATRLDVDEGVVRFSSKEPTKKASKGGDHGDHGDQGTSIDIAAGQRGVADTTGARLVPRPLLAWHREDLAAPKGLAHGHVGAGPDGQRCLVADQFSVPGPNGTNASVMAVAIDVPRGVMPFDPGIQVACTVWLSADLAWAGFLLQEATHLDNSQWHIPLDRRGQWVPITFRLADLVTTGHSAMIRPGEDITYVMIQSFVAPKGILYVSDIEVMPPSSISPTAAPLAAPSANP